MFVVFDVYGGLIYQVSISYQLIVIKKTSKVLDLLPSPRGEL